MRLPLTPAWAVVAAVLLSCAPQPSRTDLRVGDAPRAAESSAPKVLTIAVSRELKNFARFTGVTAGGGSPGSGNNQVAKIAHNYLAVREGNIGAWQPQLAAELPSLDRGTWRVNSDGTMDTTWKLRPNVTWHDGTPFGAADLELGSALFRDSDFPLPTPERIRQIRSTSAPDPLTFVIHWSSTVATATDPTDIDPMPRHLLEDLYRTDKMALLGSQLLSSEFVGLGPYRVALWEPGVQVQFTRFDEYFRGKPPLDRVVVRYVGDPNTMLANIMAGSVDLVLAPSVEMDTAAEVRQRWEGTGNQVLVSLNGFQQFLRPQFRPDFAQPRAGAPDLRVRKGLYHALDRAAVADLSSSGLAPAADSWVPPGDPLRGQLESAIPKYPYDLGRAQQLLAEAGWVRAVDGVLVHSSDGERFESKIAARPATGVGKTLAVIADGWKTIGVQMGFEILSPAAAADRRTMGTQPFALLSSFPPSLSSLPPMHSSLAASDANRWTGTNFQGYINPRVDALIDRAITTIDESQQVTVHRELLEVAMGDVALMPLYWQVEPVLIAKGVRGVTINDTWNIFEWTIS